MKTTHLARAGASAILMLLLSSGAFAHTISVGYVPTSSTGTVDFFAGTYHAGVTNDEGTGRLVGVSNGYDSGIIPFSIGVTGTKPAGLVDGTNNFYFATVPPGGSCQFGATYGSPTNTCAEGPVLFWEGLQFTGLAAGEYSFSIANDTRTTAVFQDPGAAAIRVTLRPADVTATVPEPATLALFGLGMLGFLGLRRKSRK